MNSSDDDDNEEEDQVQDQVEDPNLIEHDPYAIKVIKDNKVGIKQPRCCDNDLIPKLPTQILVCGKSGSGKTLSVINLLTNPKLLKGAFDYVLFFSGIHPDKEMIKGLNLKDDCIKVDFEEEDVKKILDKMQASCKKSSGDLSKVPSVLFFFDDILANKNFLKSNTLVKLATTSRHYNISVIYLTQYYKRLPPVVRTNCSYFIVFGSCLSELEKMAEELCPPNMSKKEFLKIAKHATKEKFQFLSINSKCDPAKSLRKGFNRILTL